jgi:hypothetical protein
MLDNLILFSICQEDNSMPRQRKMIIIGGGLAGLCAGVYAQRHLLFVFYAPGALMEQ